jgi:hypothetical protein
MLEAGLGSLIHHNLVPDLIMPIYPAEAIEARQATPLLNEWLQGVSRS